MAQVIATVEQAARWVQQTPDAGAEWNPVYRALLEAPAPVPTEGPGGTSGAAPDAASIGLVLRQLTAPALLVVAVTVGARTRRLRLGLDPTGATIERADGDQPSQWTESAVADVPAVITGFLEDAGVDLDPPRLDIRRRAEARRLTPEQTRLARAALERGVPAEDAFTSLPGLDAALRDALTAAGPRLSLALTLHDPRGTVTEQPVNWSRLWVTGADGLYRMDQPSGPALEVHPVDGGDVLGTLLPILEQGVRFAAACAASGGAR